MFFLGSPNPSSSYPGLYDTPFCMGPGGLAAPCQNEIVVSPRDRHDEVLDSAATTSRTARFPPETFRSLGGFNLRFTVYRDLPLSNLVFYQWHVRNIVDGCPGQWQDRNFVYYGPDQDYIYLGRDVISDLVGRAITVQIALGVVDMCDVWYLVNGNCAAHTPSPWFDNVRLYRYRTAGPQWSYRDLDLFQDNFPELEFTLESYVRADAANDINTNDDPVLRPGDSIVVDCTSLLGGRHRGRSDVRRPGGVHAREGVLHRPRRR